MSKETKKEFNILDTPFGEGMEMQFSDEFSEDFKENNSAVQPLIENLEDITPIVDETKEAKKEVVKDLPKEELKESKEDLKVESKESTVEEDSSIKVFASWLGEKGLVDFDAETFEDSEDGLKKLMSSTVEREVENYKKSLPEDVHRLVEFIEAGGNPKDYLDTYYGQASWSDFDVTDDDSQKIVLREYLKAQGESEEEITETLDTYEVSGILEKKSKAALSKLQGFEKQYQEQIFESQKKIDAENKIAAKKQYDDFKANLYAKEDIQGFKLTPKLKDNLWDFIMKPDKSGKTGLQKHNETNENAQFMYAYLAMNDWDISKLEIQVKNKVNSELSNRLSNSKGDSRSKIKSGQSDNFSQEKSSSNFSAFGNAIRNNLI